MKKNNVANRVKKLIFEKALPFYFPRNNAYVGGWCFAIWNCGTRPQTLLQSFKDTRITIRKNGSPKYVIKKGDL